MTTQHKCCADIGTYRVLACGKNAKFDRDGKHYCGTHDPVSRRNRLEAKQAVWQAEYDADRAADKARRAKAAEQERRADCYDDLLLACKTALMIIGFGKEHDQITDAIAKATGAA